MQLSFIVIDDSELDCYIARKLILQTSDRVSVKTFFAATDALTDIIIDDAETNKGLTVILLDLMMPEMNGFQFIETFEKLPSGIQQKYFVVALTSSMNRKDLVRLSSYQSIHFVLDKPFTFEKLNLIVEKAKGDFIKKT